MKRRQFLQATVTVAAAGALLPAAASVIVVAPAQDLGFTVDDITFIEGDGNQSHDLNQYYVSSIPFGESVTNIALAAESSELPAGVSINVANESLDFDDSVGGEASVSGVILEVTTA